MGEKGEVVTEREIGEYIGQIGGAGGGQGEVMLNQVYSCIFGLVIVKGGVISLGR